MSVQPRPALLGAGHAVHGSPDHDELAALGLDPGGVLDFSVNANAYGPSPLVRAALAGVKVDRYPDSHSGRLRQVLAEHHGVSRERVIVGNGAAELIWLLAAAYVRPGDRVTLLGPTFAEYERAARAFAAHVDTIMAPAERCFAPDDIAVAASLCRRPRLAFICNPNNPTGHLLPTEAIGAWCRASPDTLFVVDEAYLPFVPGAPSALVLGEKNLLVLRSMTKDYALAGLRLGYAVADAPVVAALEAVRPPWNVNAMAQAAGLAALSDQEHLARALPRLLEARDRLVASLGCLGLAPVPSSVHYFLVEVGDAKEFRRRLLLRGILVRDCASFGLPSYARIAARLPEENERLIEAVRGLRG